MTILVIRYKKVLCFILWTKYLCFKYHRKIRIMISDNNDVFSSWSFLSLISFKKSFVLDFECFNYSTKGKENISVWHITCKTYSWREVPIIPSTHVSIRQILKGSKIMMWIIYWIGWKGTSLLYPELIDIKRMLFWWIWLSEALLARAPHCFSSSYRLSRECSDACYE